MLGNEVSLPDCYDSLMDFFALAIPAHGLFEHAGLLIAASHVLQGTGLSTAQIRLCDSFVYIPQHGEGTASLNVTVATSIVLHHFAIWAGYQESSRHGFKYDVAAPPQRTAPRGQSRCCCAPFCTLSFPACVCMSR